MESNETISTENATEALAAGSTPPKPQAGTPEPPAGDGHENLSIEEAKKLRSESSNLRKRLKAYEDAEEQAKLAALSDAEKLTKRVTDAEQLVTRYKQQAIAYQTQLAAQQLGIIDPEIAVLLVQPTLEYGDDGMPTNLQAALKELIKKKPYLAVAKAEPEPAQEQTPPAQQAPVPPAQPNRTPAIPPMNPGRAQIAAPNANPPGKIPSWNDVYRRQ